MVDQYTVKRVYIRLLLALCALILRFIYGYYVFGVSVFLPGPLQASFFIWTAIVVVLVYMVALPSRRNPENHPHQRASDRRAPRPEFNTTLDGSNSTKVNSND